jgi:branched-chain amino acid transport system ATP-binding protein
MSLLKVNGLNVYYGPIHALKGLDFFIDDGEIVSLVGANGAGKTTTLRAISGVLQMTGEVFLENTPLNGYKAHQIVSLGIAQAPEGRGIFPQMTVFENLEMGAFSRRDKKQIKNDLENCLQMFPRLRERIRQLAGTLSGGEQQMLAISRAIMARPKLLLLDEPSLGLAPIIVSQIFDIIKELNKKGTTILLVEQNARMALKVSHRAYVIETGKIVIQGTGKDLLSNEDVKSCYLGY